jgi:hypothetical protein
LTAASCSTGWARLTVKGYSTASSQSTGIHRPVALLSVAQIQERAGSSNSPSADRSTMHDSRGLSGDQSFSGTLPDSRLQVSSRNSPLTDIQRYNGEFTYINGPLGLRGRIRSTRYGPQRMSARCRRDEPWLPESSDHQSQGLGPQCDLPADGRKAAGKRHAPRKSSAVRPRHSRRPGDVDGERLSSLSDSLASRPTNRVLAS